MPQYPDDFVEVINFGAANEADLLTLQYDFGPGTQFSGAGTIVLTGAHPSGIRRRLEVGDFYQAPLNAEVQIGDPCPLAGSQFLPPDDIFPISLFVLSGTNDQVVYACSTDVVGVVEFIYTDQTTPAPSFVGTPSPTMVSREGLGCCGYFSMDRALNSWISRRCRYLPPRPILGAVETRFLRVPLPR